MTQAQKLALARAAFRVAEIRAFWLAAFNAQQSLPSDGSADAESGRLDRVRFASSMTENDAIDSYLEARRAAGLPEIRP